MEDGRSANKTSRDLAEALAAIVESSDDAIYSKDSEGLLTSWNPAAQTLYGYTPEEAIGQPVSILIPEERKGEEFDILHRVLRERRLTITKPSGSVRMGRVYRSRCRCHRSAGWTVRSSKHQLSPVT